MTATRPDELGLPADIELTPYMVEVLTSPRRVLSAEAKAAIDRIERNANQTTLPALGR